jgi:hypothetical protein
MLISLILFYLFFSFSPAHAQMAQSDHFIMEIGDTGEYFYDPPSIFSPTPEAGEGIEVPSSYHDNTTYSDFIADAQGIYHGFPNATESSSLIQLTIDSLNLDFGGMYPGTPVTRQTNILVNSNIPMGYQLYAIQDKLLQLGHYAQTEFSPPGEREIINNTTCDNNDCHLNLARTWNDPDVAGFGYTVMSPDAVSDFDGGTKYRPFATKNKGNDTPPDESPVIIAGLPNTQTHLNNRHLTVQYKVSISPLNTAGVYTNTVDYTLVPHF